MREGWWTGFFDGLWQEVQFGEGILARAPDEARQILELLAPAAGASFLDAPCGNGRIALELAAAGHPTTGVDNWPAALSAAAAAGAARSVGIELLEADLRDLPWFGRFDHALCFWGSFGYLDDEGNRQHVEAVARALRPGGTFLVDTHTMESLLSRFAPTGCTRHGEILVCEERRLDTATGRIEVDWTFVKAQRAETRRTSIRLHTLGELDSLLRGAGFSDVRFHGSLAGEPFVTGRAQRTVAVATR